jgi:hypothetical protein
MCHAVPSFLSSCPGCMHHHGFSMSCCTVRENWILPSNQGWWHSSGVSTMRSEGRLQPPQAMVCLMSRICCDCLDLLCTATKPHTTAVIRAVERLFSQKMNGLRRVTEYVPMAEGSHKQVGSFSLISKDHHYCNPSLIRIASDLGVVNLRVTVGPGRDLPFCPIDQFCRENPRE